jgi:hypothetical protein
MYTQDRITNGTVFGFTNAKRLAWLLMAAGSFYFLAYLTRDMSICLPMVS